MKPYTGPAAREWGAYHVYDYALGFIAGWGAHPLDIAQWGLDMDHTSPVAYEGKGEIPEGGLFDTVDNWDVRCRYANGVTLRFMCDRVAKDVPGLMDDPRKRPFLDHGTTFWGEDRLGQRQPRRPLREPQGAAEDADPRGREAGRPAARARAATSSSR